MKIKRVKLTNFRNVPDLEHNINGANILVIGENAIGKSNLLKAIVATLGGNFGLDAIKHGHDNAEVEVDLAKFTNDWQPVDGTEYKFKAKIRKRKDNTEEVTLDVLMPNGLKEHRKTIIGSIVGELELDFNFVELSRSRAGKSRQVEIIKSYLTAEDKEFYAVQQSKVTQHREDRTETGRLLRTAEGALKSMTISPLDLPRYVEKKDTSLLKADIAKAATINESIKNARSIVEKRSLELTKKDDEITKAKLVVEQATLALGNTVQKFTALLENQETDEKFLVETKEISVELATDELNKAEDFNKKCDEATLFKNKELEVESLREQYGSLDAAIGSSEEAIKQSVRDMNLPIPNIHFDEEQVYYNDNPVDENHMSAAEIKLFESRLKLCKAPAAEVLLIHNGESIGNKLRCELQAMAKASNFQIIMEQVEIDHNELTIELMPDYHEKEA